jgi:hypothetical protein
MTMNRVQRKMLLGLGFDSKDGHVRITKGKNFRIFGGSEKTHLMMQGKVIKFNGELDKRKKTLDDLSEKDFRQIAKEIGLKLNK